MDERFSYRFFKLEEVFDSLSIDDSNVREIPSYHNIDSWEKYCNYISEKGAECKSIPRSVLTYKEWNKIGIDD